MAVEYEISSDVATIKGVAPNTQVARVVSLYSGQITYDDEAGSKFATATIDGKSQRVMLCIAVNGTVNYDDVPCLYSTVDGHRCLNIVAPTETGTPDDVPSVNETVVIDGMNVRAVRCILINATPVYDGVSSVCTFTGDDGKTHTAQLVNKITGGSVEVIVHGTSPLSLPDAIANSLAYLKAFGGTEQRNLPDGYIQRQFIYMMDGSYLLTDIVPTYDGHYEMDFQTTNIANSPATYLGCIQSSDTAQGLRFAHITNKAVRIGGFGSYADSASGATTANTRYKFVWNNNVGTVTTGGTTVITNVFSDNQSTTIPLAINALNTGGTISGNIEGIYLYSFKAWDNQGNLIADYVPAVQKGTVPVVGFYDTVSKTFKTATAGTFAAGGEAVPTPDTPIDIVSNNGVLRTYPDIHNTATDTLGTYLNINNAVVGNNGFGYTDYIAVVPGKAYDFGARSGSEKYILTYDENKNYLGYTNDPGTAFTYTPASGVAYIRCNFERSYQNFAIRQQGIYADGTTETINVHGKNLFDATSIRTGARLSNVLGLTYGASTSGGSDFATDIDYYVSNLIPVEVGKIYIKNSPIADAYHRFKVYDANKVSVRISSENSITIQDGEAYIAFCGLQTELNTAYCGEVFGTATAEMLLKVGDYEDVQEILSGVVTRKVGVKVFDGTEDWDYQTQVPDVMTIKSVVFPADFYSNPNNNVGYCNYYTVVATSTSLSSVLTSGQMGWNTIGNIMFKWTRSGASGVASFKQFLADQYAAGNPVTIVYPLATPTTESVAGQTLQVQQGDNFVEITQASLDNLELEAKYQAVVSLTIQEVQDANLDPNVQVTIN